MKRRLAGALLLIPFAVLAQAPARPAAPKPVRLSFVYSDGNIPSTIQALKSLLEERPDLRGRVELNFLTESMFEDAKIDSLAGADVLVLDTMNQQLLDRFNETRKTDVAASVRRRGKILAVGEGLQQREFY